ncbi:hypothetical protein Tco_0948264, partial [Tanacetum coccineum]
LWWRQGGGEGGVEMRRLLWRWLRCDGVMMAAAVDGDGDEGGGG